MSKDQTIGGLIFVVCVVIVVGYVVALFAPKFVVDLLRFGSVDGLRYWLIAVPVLIALVAVLGIGAWIGWTMATTPPPKPIEEIEAEEKKEEAKPEGEEKAAEKKK